MNPERKDPLEGGAVAVAVDRVEESRAAVSAEGADRRRPHSRPSWVHRVSIWVAELRDIYYAGQIRYLRALQGP